MVPEIHSPLIDRIAGSLVRRRHYFLLAAMIAACLCLLFSPKLDFNRSMQNMFASDDQILPDYRKLTSVFGSNEAVLLVFESPGLLEQDQAGIERIARLTQRVEQVDGVAEVISLSQLDKTMRDVFGISIVASRPPAPAFRDLFVNLTHSEDGHTAALVCFLESWEASNLPRREIVADLRGVVAELPPDHPQVLITGEPVMIVDGFRLVEEDGRMLSTTSTLLLGLVILACFRSLRWVIIPLLTVQLTLLVTRATLAWSGIQLSMVSSMFSAIVTVIGVATVVHLIVRYREGRRLLMDERESLLRSLRILIAPIVWACLTDAAGFSALMFSSIGPVQDFGMMMLLGSLIVLVAAAFVVPGLALWKLPKGLQWLDIEPQRAWSESLLDAELGRPLRWIERFPYLLLSMTGILFVVAIWGVTRADVESDFTRNFRRDSEIVRSYEFVESNLGGGGVWDVIVPAPETVDYEFIQRIDQLEERLRNEVRITDDDGTTRPGLTKVLSLSDALRATWPLPIEDSYLLLGARTVRYFLPKVAKDWPTDADSLIARLIEELNKRMPELIKSFHAPDPESEDTWYFRIMLRSLEQQTSRQKQEIVRQVKSILAEEFPSESDSEPQPRVSGFFVLLAHLVNSLMGDQWKTFAIATAMIFLMMWFAFRSPVLAAIGLVPNVLIIMLVLGTLGLTGIKINMGAAMIAAVSIGLSIDSSIHYIISFQRARLQELSVAEALLTVQERVGRALVFSTVALIAGFSVLCLSEFVPTIYFGALVSLSMFGGLLGNLLILPLLLRLGVRD